MSRRRKAPSRKRRHSGGAVVSVDGDGTARVSLAGLADSEEVAFLETLVAEAARAGMPVLVNGEELTAGMVEDLKAELPDAADPPDASIGWPENVGAHDQAAAALLDWLTEPEGSAGCDRAWATLTETAAAMPAHASVSVVVELSDGHVLATLLARVAPAITLLFYGADDPDRVHAAREAQAIALPGPDPTGDAGAPPRGGRAGGR